MNGSFFGSASGRPINRLQQRFGLLGQEDMSRLASVAGQMRELFGVDADGARAPVNGCFLERSPSCLSVRMGPSHRSLIIGDDWLSEDGAVDEDEGAVECVSGTKFAFAYTAGGRTFSLGGSIVKTAASASSDISSHVTLENGTISVVRIFADLPDPMQSTSGVVVIRAIADGLSLDVSANPYRSWVDIRQWLPSDWDTNRVLIPLATVGMTYNDALSVPVFTDIFWSNDSAAPCIQPHTFLNHPWRLETRRVGDDIKYSVNGGYVYDGYSYHKISGTAWTTFTQDLWFTLVITYYNGATASTYTVETSTTGYVSPDYELDVISGYSESVAWEGWAKIAIPIGYITYSSGISTQRLYDNVLVPKGLTVKVRSVIGTSYSENVFSDIYTYHTYINGNLVGMDNPALATVFTTGPCS